MKKLLVFSLFMAAFNLNSAFSQANGTGQDKKEIRQDRAELARDRAEKNRDEDDQKKFVSQSQQLKEALEAREMNRAYALQNALLQSMNREIGEMQTKVAHGRDVGTDRCDGHEKVLVLNLQQQEG